MRTVYAQACIRFPLGKQGENEAARVVWAGIVEEFRKLYGSGVFTLTAKRCGDAEAYPVAVSTEGGDVVWLVRAADVASPGSGSCELTYTVDGAVAKSQTWSTYVAASISGDAPGEPPEEPAKAWFAAIQAQIGNLDDLTTKARASLVAAVNEAARTGSGGAGSISMRTADGYIQYSTDGGANWANLIALAELKGAPGQDGAPGKDGEPGKDGHTPKIAATKTGKTTSITADGLEIAQIKDGEDAAADLSLGITGAQVGQIAKISAVDTDGKPTAWEPVDMAGGETWEKLVDTSLAEPVESVTYTFDNCKRIKALIAPVIASGEYVSGWKRFTINNVSYPSLSSKINSYEGVCLRIDSEYPPYAQANVNVNTKLSVNGLVGGVYTAALENIAPNGITEFGCQTAGILKAGTKIEIWGVKS